MPDPICSLVNFFGLFRLWLGLGSFLDPLITFGVTAFNSWSSRGVLINHRTLNLLLLQHLSRNTKLVDPDKIEKCPRYAMDVDNKPGWVHLVDVALVEEDEEHHVVPVQILLILPQEQLSKRPEAANAVHGWHLDDESKDVINEGVQSLRKILFVLPLSDISTL